MDGAARLWDAATGKQLGDPMLHRGRVYRALDHKTAKKVLQSSEAAALSSVIADFGNAFAVLQERRHQADYDPASFQYYFSETEALVELAHSAIQKLDSLSPDERRTLAVLILFKQR